MSKLIVIIINLLLVLLNIWAITQYKSWANIFNYIAIGFIIINTLIFLKLN
jgi:hypothetical protein